VGCQVGAHTAAGRARHPLLRRKGRSEFRAFAILEQAVKTNRNEAMFDG
jgi:hypothetical protein